MNESNVSCQPQNFQLAIRIVCEIRVTIVSSYSRIVIPVVVSSYRRIVVLHRREKFLEDTK